MLKILIADDHDVVREGLKKILLSQWPDAEFGDAGNGGEALALVRKKRWDVVILDISMPGVSGLEALKELKSVLPKQPVLVLSMHPESQYAVRVMKSGASGYITKDTISDEIVHAIKKIVAGGKYVSESLAENLATHFSESPDTLPHERLSDREFEIMVMLASGKTVSEIADNLSISVKTVSTHRAHILEKMSLANNAELTRYAFEHKLVQ